MAMRPPGFILLAPFAVVTCSPQIYPQFTASALLSPAEYAIVCGMLKPWTALAEGGSLLGRPRPRLLGESRRMISILRLTRADRRFRA